MTTKQEVTKLLSDIGVPQHLLGYRYLREVIVLCLEDQSLLRGVMDGVYVTISEQHETNVTNLERNIRSAVVSAFKGGSNDTIKAVFGNNYTKRPTNVHFIAACVYYISEFGKD